MIRPVWGTLAVNDHLAPDAFLREVLLFDRLVIPVPATAAERDRWRHPNPKDPTETWDPDRQEQLLGILGTPDEAGHNNARIAWLSRWDEEFWRNGQQRRGAAQVIDSFAWTRLMLTEGVPGIVDAVPAYPSERAWRAEERPLDQRPAEEATPAGAGAVEANAAEALVALAVPLLVPEPRGDLEAALRESVALSCDPSFRKAREAYYEWLRTFADNLRREGDPGLDQVAVDEGSLQLAKENLDILLNEQRALIGKQRGRTRWGTVQIVATVLAAGAGLTAAMNPFFALGALPPAMGLAGWMAQRRQQLPQDQPLNGASMFAFVERRPGWGAAGNE